MTANPIIQLALEALEIERDALAEIAAHIQADSGAAVPRVLADASLTELMREMSAKGLGAAAIVDAAGKPLGIFTDGDLRRHIEAGTELRSKTAGELMHTSPRSIRAQALAVDAVALMEEHHINSVLAIDENGVLVGALNTHDLLRAKVI